MLYHKFQRAEHSGSEEEYLSMYVYGSNPVTPRGLPLNKLGKRSPANATYQISSTLA